MMHRLDNIFLVVHNTKERIKKIMEMELFITGEENREKKSVIKIGGIILWMLMILVSIFYASRSLIL
ncbi:MAG: hypothetical protein K2P30_05930 [Lachnospiraceae bacterium]|nr:hypothetical protein [Lachnospiraceae bacterium]